MNEDLVKALAEILGVSWGEARQIIKDLQERGFRLTRRNTKGFTVRAGARNDGSRDRASWELAASVVRH